MKTLKEKLLRHIEETGMVRSRNLKALAIPPYYLNLLEKEGKIQKLSRGIYASKEYEYDEKQGYIEVCARVPEAVVCLLSALTFYEITTQNPYQIWIAMGVKSRKPNLDYPPVRVFRFSGKAFSEGIKVFERKGIKIKVYCPAKTVADCFKYRNKIGIDVAIEALREGWKNKLFTLDEVGHYAKICRVQKIIRPYIESLL